MAHLDLLTLESLFLAITTIFVFEVRHLRWAVYGYIVQALTLVSILITIAYQYNCKDLYLWSATAFVTKAVLVPYILFHLLNKVKASDETSPIAGPLTPFIAVAFSVSLAVILSPIFLKFATIKLYIPLTVSIAVFLMGSLGFVLRKCAFKQILSFCLSENGIHLGLALMVPSSTETVEIGMLSDAVFAVLIMSILAARLYRFFGSFNTSKADYLKG